MHGILLLTIGAWAPASIAAEDSQRFRWTEATAQGHSRRDYEEEQERLAREKQMQDDLDQYMERWRENRNAPSFTSLPIPRRPSGMVSLGARQSGQRQS